MAVEDSPGTNSGDAERVAGAAQSVVSGLRAQLGEPPPVEQPPPSSSETGNDPNPLDGTYRLDLGDGVNRDVSSKDLLEAYLNRDAAAEAERVAQTTLQKSVGAQSLLAELEKMDEETRGNVLELLRDPKALTARLNAQTPQGSEQNGDPLDQILHRPPPANGTQQPELVNLVRQLAERQNQIMGHINGEIAAKRTETLADQVGRAMDSFPVFKESSPGKTMAHESVMTALAANPEQDVQTIVAKHATSLHQILKGRSAAVPEPRDARGRFVADDLQVPKDQPGGDALMNGGVARDIRAALDALDSR